MKKYLLTIIVAMLMKYSYAQNEKKNDSLTHQKIPFIWIDFGLGLVYIGNTNTKADQLYSNPHVTNTQNKSAQWSANASVNLIIKKNIFTVCAFEFSDFQLFGGGEQRESYSILYGRYISCEKNTFVSISSGLSLVNIIYSDPVGVIPGSGSWLFGPSIEYKTRSVYYPGLAFKAQAFAHSKFLGIGLALIANLNMVRSYAGLAMSIALGKIKR